MRLPVRPPSLIALRARRQALQIARDVAYPELRLPPPPPPLWPVDMGEERWQELRLAYAPTPVWMVEPDPPPEPAPRWMAGLAIGCACVIAGAAAALLCAR